MTFLELLNSQGWEEFEPESSRSQALTMLIAEARPFLAIFSVSLQEEASERESTIVLVHRAEISNPPSYSWTIHKGQFLDKNLQQKGPCQGTTTLSVWSFFDQNLEQPEDII